MKEPTFCSCGCGEEIPAKHLFRYSAPYFLRGHQTEAFLCQCGCDEPIPWRPEHRYRRPKNLPGHQSKTRRDAYVAMRKAERPENPTPKECECGCGQMTTIPTKTYFSRGVIAGVPRRFVSGHNSKGMKRGEGRYMNNLGYILLRMPDHPRAPSNGGYVLEHRYLMEQHIGRFLEMDEHVHHINHDRSDNRIENLMIIDAVTHAKYHTSQVRRPQSEEHRRKAAEAVRAHWASLTTEERHARAAKAEATRLRNKGK